MLGQTKTKTGLTNLERLELPSDLSDQLPIFKILGNKIPDKMKTPEAKKTFAMILYAFVFGTIGYGLIKITPTLLNFTGQFLLLLIYGIVAVTLIMLFPKIVNLLHTWGTLMLFKGERALAREYGIETLELSLAQVKQAQEEVQAKITRVEGVLINTRTEATNQENISEEKLRKLKKITEEAGKLQDEGDKLISEGKTEEGNICFRQANEYRASALILKAEYESARKMAASYAQYANQFAKALNVLKDNESGVKIYVNLLASSIKITRDRLEATGKMRSATEGLADIFDVENKWQFQVALSAVQEQISDNLAGVRRNLQFLNENRIDNISNQMSQEDLEKFVNDIDNSQMSKINVQDIASPYHNLTSDEKVDKGFDIFK